MAFAEAGIEIEFKGTGVNEVGIVKSCSQTDFQLKTGAEVINVDEKYFRPTEVELLIGDATQGEKTIRVVALIYFTGIDF